MPRKCSSINPMHIECDLGAPVKSVAQLSKVKLAVCIKLKAKLMLLSRSGAAGKKAHVMEIGFQDYQFSG